MRIWIREERGGISDSYCHTQLAWQGDVVRALRLPMKGKAEGRKKEAGEGQVCALEGKRGVGVRGSRQRVGELSHTRGRSGQRAGLRTRHQEDGTEACGGQQGRTAVREGGRAGRDHLHRDIQIALRTCTGGAGTRADIAEEW